MLTFDLSHGERNKIHIGVLLPNFYHQDYYYFQSAIELSAKMINDDADILQDYEIILHIRQTDVRFHICAIMLNMISYRNTHGYVTLFQRKTTLF